MDINKRFDQLESLLVDLARKQDQQSEQLAQIITELNRQGEAINQLSEAIGHQGKAIDRIEYRLGTVSEQIGDIINIFKISEARHSEVERQQADMLLEIQRLGKRTDASVEAIKLLFNRQETANTRLDGMVQTQLQMLQLQRLDADKIDELNRRLPATEGQEPRIKRLEDEVFRATS